MSDTEQSTKPKVSITDQLRTLEHALVRYVVIFFVVLLLGVYGFITYRIYTASQAKPSDNDVSARLDSTSALHINPNVINEMQSLQDNSVNVKTLFDQARSNPFQE